VLGITRFVSFLLSMQMITCMCIQNYTALTCDVYEFDHPGVTTVHVNVVMIFGIIGI